LSVEKRSVRYGTHVIEFSLVRRDRRTLEIAVEPDASVVVTAPADAGLEAVHAKVRRRAAWIRHQQRYFAQFLPSTPLRRYLAGETHLYLGRQHRLKIAAGHPEAVKVARGFIHVTTRYPEDPRSVEALVEDWYRERARRKFAEKLEISLRRFPNPEAHRPKALIVRRIKRRWGSMSPAGRLLLNLRLIEAPATAIDYVITHELCHVAEPNHGRRFFALLTKVMPDWEKRKQHLERLMA
jgi:predicted metal-dependent hydrolase